MSKNFSIRMQSGGTGLYGNCPETREVVGDFYKVSQTGDLSIFHNHNVVTLIVAGEWLELNVTEHPTLKDLKMAYEKPTVKPITLDGNDIDVSALEEDPTDEILNAIYQRRG